MQKSKDKVTVDLMPLLRRVMEEEDKDSRESQTKKKQRLVREIKTTPKIKHTAKSLAMFEKMQAEKEVKEGRIAKTQKISRQMEGKDTSAQDKRSNVNVLNVRFDLKKNGWVIDIPEKTSISSVGGSRAPKVQSAAEAIPSPPGLSVKGVAAKQHKVEEKLSKMSLNKPLEKSKLRPKRQAGTQRQEAKKPPWR